MEEESFHILTEKDALIVQAKDELGFVYGLYHISKEILNIQEFWFWNDQKFEKREYVKNPVFCTNLYGETMEMDGIKG